MPIQFDPFVASQGLAAGLAGKLPEFQQTQNQKAQLDLEKKKQDDEMQIKIQESQFKDAYAAQQLLSGEDYDGIVKLGITRLTMLQGLNANPAETQRVLKLAIAARNGDPDARRHLKGELDSAVKVGVATGVLKAPEKEGVEAVNPTFNVINSATGKVLQKGTPEAQDQYRPLTSDEEKKYNPNGDKTLQMNITTNKVEQIGSSPSTNINMPAGMNALDSYFATNVVGPWINGGQVTAMSNIASLSPVLQKLVENNGAPLTGAVISTFPDYVKKFFPAGVESLNAKQLVEQVVQRNVREILGAQFTQVEGENMVKRAYDDRLPEIENAQRLQRLLTAMKIGADQKQAQVEYWNKNNTISGFTGKLSTLEDFNNAIDGVNKDEYSKEEDPFGIL
jgi:hypothetical protein